MKLTPGRVLGILHGSAWFLVLVYLARLEGWRLWVTFAALIVFGASVDCVAHRYVGLRNGR